VADTPLRVAVLSRAVHPFHGVGGLERHVFDLVRHLALGGARVTLITRPPAGSADQPLAEAFAVPGGAIEVITVPYVTFPGAGRRGTTVIDRSTAYPLFGWRAGRVAVRLTRLGKVDVVHALGASGLGYAQARLRHEFTVPFVLNPQGLEEFGATHPGFARLKRIGYRPLQTSVRTCARAADAVIATDRSLVPTVLRHLPVEPSRVHVLPNAVDLAGIDARRAASSREAMRASLGLSPTDLLVLSVGRLEANKGFHVLAEALGMLERRLRASSPHQPWRWALVGGGPYRGRIMDVATGAQVQSRMIVPGRVDDVALADWYAAADLFVHPTLYEGSSLVTLEAMARGLPVVATRAGGLPDKVVPGETGWLVEPGRADALGNALAEAFASRRAFGRLGAAGRALVEREFSWTAVGRRTLELYGRLTRGTMPDQPARELRDPRW
jgi:glycosyltransferase involved in cell wall biosynthesis